MMQWPTGYSCRFVHRPAVSASTGFSTRSCAQLNMEALKGDFLHPEDGCGAEFISRLLREMSGMGNHNAADSKALEEPVAAKLLPAELIVYGGIFVLILELLPGLVMIVSRSRVWQRRACLIIFVGLHCPTAPIRFIDFGSVGASALVAADPEEVAWSQKYWAMFQMSPGPVWARTSVHNHGSTHRALLVFQYKDSPKE